jgi:hypothetical protein
MWARDAYYHIKPFIPRRLQIALRRTQAKYMLRKCGHVWPIDERTACPPWKWPGWPGGKRFALVLTHDVDTARGQMRTKDLIALEESLGFRSSFNFVPLRYAVSPDLRALLEKKGFEVGVHGLYHDGKYYLSKKTFQERAARINGYLREWRAVGYRAPSMLHKLDWFHQFNIEYDASTFDTDPFEPDSTAMCSIFPFFVKGANGYKGYVELPYTLPQDFTLFVLLKNTSLEIWKKKLDWVARNGGMALMNTHPDYMHFGTGAQGYEEYPSSYYGEFLQYVRDAYGGQYWHALPREVARFWNEAYAKEGRR